MRKGEPLHVTLEASNSHCRAEVRDRKGKKGRIDDDFIALDCDCKLV